MKRIRIPKSGSKNEFRFATPLPPTKRNYCTIIIYNSKIPLPSTQEKLFLL